MVRHGEADANWSTSTDPALSQLGQSQANQVATKLAHLNNIAIISSPLLRCQQTAQPFSSSINTPISIHPEVAEIPSPLGIAMADRGAWLQQAMHGTWQQLGSPFIEYKNTIAQFVTNLTQPTVIFSHYVAINAVIGAATSNDAMYVHNLDNCSVTTFHIDTNNNLTLIEAGAEAPTVIG
jgi:broad specificity phosphatase PhoE